MELGALCCDTENAEAFDLVLEKFDDKMIEWLLLAYFSYPNPHVTLSKLLSKLTKKEIPLYHLTIACAFGTPECLQVLASDGRFKFGMGRPLLTCLFMDKLNNLKSILSTREYHKSDLVATINTAWLLRKEDFAEVLFPVAMKELDLDERYCLNFHLASTPQFIQLLKKRKQDFNSMTDGIASLVYGGERESLAYLLDYADFKSADGAETLNVTLFTAILFDRLDLVQLLIESGRVNHSSLLFDYIFFCKDNNKTEILDYLVSKGIQPKSEQVHLITYTGLRAHLQYSLNRLEREKEIAQSELSVAPLFNHPYPDLTSANGAQKSNLFGMYVMTSFEGGIEKLLLEEDRIDFTINNQIIFVQAIEAGNVEIVKKLLGNPNINPGFREGEALVKAVEANRMECLDLILADGRSNVENSAALTTAILASDLDMVKKLAALQIDSLTYNFFVAVNLPAGAPRWEILEYLYSFDSLREKLQTKGLVKEGAVAPVNEGLKALVDFIMEVDQDDYSPSDYWKLYAASSFGIAAAIGYLAYWKWGSSK
eukprot:TRINITY_DN6605_c0_g1_i1.p1 TRINITY_DN6605_c0_g1~~TRINITY_DN6605_c0_g1_i1.p1  ORF type:complete len:541 (-),score=153.84 TRINITY_DN6605_c0_g1_i1:45-1667(-)